MDDSAKSFGWVLAGIIFIGVMVWVSSSPSATEGDNTTSATSVAAPESSDTNLVAAGPPPPSPLDRSAAQRGYAQFRKLAGLSADGSAQIYSRNCYEAIGKVFDWHQLDRCGGFDAIASRWTDEAEAVDADALSYFQSETAATRFLQAAASNGLSGAEADQRWARIQAMAQQAKIGIKHPKVAELTDITNSLDVTLNGEAETNTFDINEE